MKKIEISVLVLFLLITSIVHAADKGKVAVAAEGQTVNALVSEVAARSPYFLIFEENGKFMEAVDNPYKAAKGGAGTSVVPFLAQMGVTFVVAGEFGTKMLQGMKSNGIKYLEFHGSAEAALKKVQEAKR